MTKAEIEAKAAFLADNLHITDEGDRDYLKRMVLTLVALAYEDAARVAEASATRTYIVVGMHADSPNVAEWSARHDEAQKIKRRLDTLKDSLTAEASSTK